MKDFNEFIDDVVEMRNRKEEFIDCLGGGKTEHELNSELEELDIDNVIEADDELLKYPAIKRYIKPEDDLKKLNDTIIREGKNQNGRTK